MKKIKTLDLRKIKSILINILFKQSDIEKRWRGMKGSSEPQRFRFVKIDGRLVKIDLNYADRVFEKFEKDERIAGCQKKLVKK